MTNTMPSPRHGPGKLQCLLTRFGYKHPYLAYGALFLAVPIALLLALGVSTTALLLPIAWTMGWL